MQRKAEEGLWKQAEAVRGRPEEAAVIDRLLTAFENGIYADRARERRDVIRREREVRAGPTSKEVSDKAQADFEKAAQTNTPEGWSTFLRAHPTGSLATLARYNLTVLASARAQRQAAAQTPRSESSAARAAPSYHFVSGLDPDGDNWLALRSEPSGKTGRQKLRMGPGTLLKVSGTQGAWYQVELQSGETGWVFRKYVSCCRAQ